MEDPGSLAASAPLPDYSEGWAYPALVLLTIPLSAIISNSFPLTVVVASVTGSPGFDAGPYFILWQLATTVLMLFVFYKVGEKVDFSKSYRRLALLAFAGALIGNLPGFYVYTSGFFGGSGWGYGFGYVSSFGIAEPSSLIELLTAAVASFMVPLAGLALAHFRFQFLSPAGEAGADGGSKGSFGHLSPFVVSFAVVAAALPVASLVRSLFVSAPFPLFPSRDASQQLIPGYVAFLVYPTLLLVVFYLMGGRLDLDLWDTPTFKRFALSVFIGAVTGLFVGDALNLWIEGSSITALNMYDLGGLSAALFSVGVMVAILAFAATSLGYVARNRDRFRAPAGSEHPADST